MKCEICGKSPSFGNSITRRGLAKKKGGVGQKITGITRRRFKPNIQKVRVRTGGGVKRMRVCARCIKSGKIIKV
jgi:large subunit ribosomal protein L28